MVTDFRHKGANESVQQDGDDGAVRGRLGDRMGKGSAATPRFSGGYIGPDREHWSNNLLCGTYLLTGS